MTYEEVVDKIRGIYEDSDARMIFEHIAIQINIVGEASGVLYMEVADRHISVEPYDYYDRDGLMTLTADAVCRIERGEMTIADGIKNGEIKIEGNMDKFLQLQKIVIRSRKPVKKTAKASAKTTGETKAVKTAKTAKTAKAEKIVEAQ